MTSPDAPEDSAERFAEDLRLLRVQAGSPTLARLQHSTGISRTVISDAFGGRQLPSARTVDGIVKACGAEPETWLRRRDRLAARFQAPVGHEQPAERSAPIGRPDRPRMLAIRRSTAVGAALGALLLGGIAGGAVAAAVTVRALEAKVAKLERSLEAAGPVNPHAQIQVRTGVDPAMTPCVNDAKVASSEDRVDNTRIQIIWSNKCYAGWGRITRYDNKADGNVVFVAIYPETAPTGPDRQEAHEPGVQSAYTTLIVRPSPKTRLCAIGSITLDGKTIDLGDPICT